MVLFPDYFRIPPIHYEVLTWIVTLIWGFNKECGHGILCKAACESPSPFTEQVSLHLPRPAQASPETITLASLHLVKLHVELHLGLMHTPFELLLSQEEW